MQVSSRTNQESAQGINRNGRELFLDRRMTILSERAFPEATAFPVPDLPEADLTGLMPSTTAGVASRRSCRQETEMGLDRNYPLI